MKGEGTHGDVEQATGRKGKGSFKGDQYVWQEVVTLKSAKV